MSVSCEPNDLSSLAKCFCGLSEKQQSTVRTYLLAVIAGGSIDPNVLAAEAAQFVKLNPIQSSVEVYLLCAIANT